MLSPWRMSLLIFLIGFAILTLIPKVNPFFNLNLSNFIFVTVLVTLFSYQESTRQQFMQMYHLIPVALNIKFFSKQLITLIIYPSAIMGIFLISTMIKNIIFDQPNHIIISQSNHDPSTFSTLVVIWIFGHSFCTLTAIIFQKNKIMRSIQAYVLFKLIVGAVLFSAYWLLCIKHNPFSLISNPTSELAEKIVLLIMASLCYGLSYRLFKKRQLSSMISFIMDNTNKLHL